MSDFASMYLIGMGVALVSFVVVLGYCSFLVPNRDGIDPE